MSIISAWAAGKGISISEGAVKRWLEIPSTEALIQDEVGRISSKLDILIGAPYRQALMHLRQGNLDRAQDKLIEAISLNELDLPARLLYIDLLRYHGRYDLALEYCWDALERFGPKGELMPPDLASAYEHKFFSTLPDELYDHKIRGPEDYVATDTYCSPGGIVCRWMPWSWRIKKKLTKVLLWKRGKVIVNSWNGISLGHAEDKGDKQIHTVTTKYAVLEDSGPFWALDDSKEYSVCRLEVGYLLPQKLSGYQVGNLFDSSLRAYKHWGTGAATPEDIFRFDKAVITRGRWVDTKTTTGRVSAGRYSHNYENIEWQEGGTLEISFPEQ